MYLPLSLNQEYMCHLSTSFHHQTELPQTTLHGGHQSW